MEMVLLFLTTAPFRGIVFKETQEWRRQDPGDPSKPHVLKVASGVGETTKYAC